MFRLKEPDKEEYVIYVPRDYFEIFNLFFADAGYKAGEDREPISDFKNRYGYFYINKAEKSIYCAPLNLTREEEYGLMELIEKADIKRIDCGRLEAIT